MIRFVLILALLYVLYLALRGLPKTKARKKAEQNGGQDLAQDLRQKAAQELVECHSCGVYFEPAETVQKGGKLYCRKCLESL
ncbi:MAG: PP0621 family protein [Helicobacteraceae bacterium]